MSEHDSMALDETVWDMRCVQETTRFTETTIYRLLDERTFPQPRRVSKRAIGWRRSEVLEWIRTRPVAKASDVRRPLGQGQ